ncbi:FHA domain-containing protein [bacterium]|nr:FHA domain-containing protein [bacterium]
MGSSTRIAKERAAEVETLLRGLPPDVLVRALEAALVGLPAPFRGGLARVVPTRDVTSPDLEAVIAEIKSLPVELVQACVATILEVASTAALGSDEYKIAQPPSSARPVSNAGAMTLDSLCRAVVSETAKTFMERHPSPALVFLSAFEPADAARVDTPGTGDFPIQGFKPPAAGSGPTPLMDRVPERKDKEPGFAFVGGSDVLFLAKTKRNPFADMITIGRAPNNDVWLPVGSISKLHAYFTSSTEGWKIHDHHSTNGTTIDSNPVPRGGFIVSDGTQIGLGDLRATFFTPPGLFRFLARYRAAKTN